MERWIADVWVNEDRVNYAVAKIVIEDYLDDFLRGRSFFVSEELARENALSYIEKNLGEYEKDCNDADMPKRTQKI